MMDPTNKVTKNMATFIEEKVAGLMSILVAATGRIERLSGEGAGEGAWSTSLMRLVDHGQASVCVKAVKTVEGGVLIEAQIAKDLDFFRASEALKPGGLTVTEPEAPRRRPGVFAVPAETTEEEILTALRKQVFPLMGERDFRATIRVARKFGGRGVGPRGTNWVLEATPDTARGLAGRGRVFLGWTSCAARDFVEAGHCAWWLEFSHVARSCSKQAKTCGWCAGDGYTAAGCLSKGRPPRCVNCAGADLRSTLMMLEGAWPFYSAMLDREKAVAVERRTTAAVQEKR